MIDDEMYKLINTDSDNYINYTKFNLTNFLSRCLLCTFVNGKILLTL